MQTENSLTSSIDGLLSKKDMFVNRSTSNFQNEELKIRENDRFQLHTRREKREAILFGDLHSLERARDTHKLESRNCLYTKYNLDNKNNDVEDIDDIPSDDCFDEENFGANINEHDDEILLKSVDIHHHNEVIDPSDQNNLINIKPFLLPENGLEVIKETEDVIMSPNKPQSAESKLTQLYK